MKIAVVGPSPVPYTTGGMEKLLWQMTEKINQLTSHQAEIIKLPSREDSFWSLLDSYYAFWKLDLSHFDMVLSTKYPSWMISHPNHICYMIHKLRGLYDTYHLTGLPREVNTSCSHTKKLLEFLDSSWDRPDIKLFWEVINEYRAYSNKIPADNLSFPGPLIRKIIHYLDNGALAPSRIRRYCTMSQTVANREGYFPDNAKVVIANPPPANDFIGNVTYGDYFFTVSRLDNAKRVNLLVEAMKEVKCDVGLVIAGTGPDEDELKEKAKSDKRISFKGYCNDLEVAELYDNCLAVLYVPYEEDYGLVTVEAFLRSKPVITCNDSGGATEFVKDGKNGFVVHPKPSCIAIAMANICENRDEAKRMGQNALGTARSINWENFIEKLLPGSQTIEKPVIRRPARKKIIVTSTFPIYPPRGGGQSRVYNLYKNLAMHYDIEIISFTNGDQPPLDQEIAPGMREVRFPKSKIHQKKEWEIENKIGIPITDVAMPSLSRYTPEYGESLGQKAKNAEIVILSHPYLYDEISAVDSEIRLIYEAQDVEYDLKSKVLPPKAKKLLDDVYRVEKLCCENSELVMTCSEEDAKRLVNLYGVDINKFVVVPNGVDVSSVSFTPCLERRENKRKLGLENESLVLFMGSWHPPNLEACREVFKIAEQLPEVKFLLLGSQCLAFRGQSIPANVGLLGVVDEDEKDIIFGMVDLALNPMLSGSGTNLKMFDYMAAGIPVISTEFGARGMGAINGEHLIICQPTDMLTKVQQLLNGDSITIERMIDQALSLIKTRFDWRIIASAFCDKLGDIGNKNVDSEYEYRPLLKSNDFNLCVNQIKNQTVIGCINNSLKNIIDEILNSFKADGYVIKENVIKVAEYKSYVSDANYESLYKNYYADNFHEKYLEHYLTSINLALKKGDIFIDVASEHSPVPEIYKRLFKVKSYSQDIMYPKGINGNKIGGDACNMPIPNNYADKISLTCSLEHFEGDSDSKLIKELDRVLRPGGIVYIIPFYLFNIHAIQTDPTVSVPNNVLFDKDAVVYCCEGWGNRHGRFYDYKAFKERIEPFLGALIPEIQYYKNLDDIHESCYGRFALKLLKSS